MRWANRMQNKVPHASENLLAAHRRVVAGAALVVGLVALLVTMSGAPSAAETRTLKLYNTHTKERAQITFKRNGRYIPSGLREVNRFLRDWRRNEITEMDPELLDLIWEIYRKTRARDYIHVVSAYRSPATNSMLRSRSRGVAKKSQHTLGKAMDFYIPGVKLSALRAAGLRMQEGGVGFYPTSGSPFVHMDTGSVRHWPRMTRTQLARVFPDGKTVHVPSDRKPMPRYEEALAELQRRDRGETARIQVASADGAQLRAERDNQRDRDAIVGLQPQTGNANNAGFLTALFANNDGGTDNSSSTTDARETASTPVPARTGPSAPPPARAIVTVAAASNTAPITRADANEARSTPDTSAANRSGDAEGPENTDATPAQTDTETLTRLASFIPLRKPAPAEPANQTATPPSARPVLDPTYPPTDAIGALMALANNDSLSPSAPQSQEEGMALAGLMAYATTDTEIFDTTALTAPSIDAWETLRNVRANRADRPDRDGDAARDLWHVRIMRSAYAANDPPPLIAPDLRRMPDLIAETAALDSAVFARLRHPRQRAMPAELLFDADMTPAGADFRRPTNSWLMPRQTPGLVAAPDASAWAPVARYTLANRE